MKKILLTLVLLIGIVVGLFAQKLTYQAVIRDNNQQLVVNTAVKATVTITFTSGVPYAEEVNGSTNIHGLLSFEFGDETLAGRDWTGATIAVKVVNAATPSTVYVNDEARPVSAVPYALNVNGQSIQNYLTEHNYVDETELDSRHYLTSDSTVITTMQGNIATNANNITTNANNIAALANRVNTFNTNVCDSVATCIGNAIDARGFLTSDSAVITTMQGNIANLTQHTTKSAIRDSVAGQIHDSIADIAAKSHTHGNKDLLDTYNQTNADLADAVAKKHAHDNAAVLAATTAPYTDADSIKLKGIAEGAEVNVQADWNQSTTTADDYIKNKPTIPAAANNATLTIQKNGTSVGTFTADASSDKSINITVPTTTSELTNNSGFITTANVPTNVSQLNNDAGYVSNSNCPTVDLCELYNMMTSLQNTIARQDSMINALNNEHHSFTCGTSTVSDHEGNVYNTVKIGNQCWMAQNLRTSTNTASTGNIYTPTTSEVPGYDVNTYGRLYDWAAVMQGASSSDAVPSGVQGICPTGWHVPSDAEWDTLTYYVFNSTSPDYKCGSSCGSWAAQSNVSCIANALSSSTGWSSSNSDGCNAGNTGVKANATGFSAVPAGYCLNGDFRGFGLGAFFWSATQYFSNGAWSRDLNGSGSSVDRYGDNKAYGFSVRCLRDAGVGGTPGSNETAGTTPSAPATMSCEQVMECMGDTLGQLNAKIEAQGAEIETLNGTVTSQGQTIETLNSTVESQGNTIDSLAHLVDSLSNLPHGGGGTPTVADGQPCPGTATVSDVDGNTYNTVKIGNQCWMKENLRTTTKRNNVGNVYTENTTAGYNAETYGYYYDWEAVMQNESGDKVQGICPTGWHVPTWAEYLQLTDYVNSQPIFCCYGESGKISKALASSEGWASVDRPDSECCIGNAPARNNWTRFSLMPAGHYLSEYRESGMEATIWSATDFGSMVHVLWLDAASDEIGETFCLREMGCSVRCLRDASIGGGDNPSEPATMSCEQVMECMGDTLGKLNEKIEEQGTEIETLNGTVTSQGQTIETLNSTVESQGNTIDSLAHLVDSLSNLIPGGGDTPTEVADGQPCPGAPTVSDVDGNTYNTVKIGNQCWMKENLRTKTHQYGQVWTKTDADSAIYGRYYDWQAAMQIEQGNSTSYTAGDKHRGICPAGWHVPSDAEWTALTVYVNSVEDYKCEGGIAKALASKTGWEPEDSDCSVGNAPDNNDATGFSAVPAGYCFYGDSNDFGNYAYFWSATQSDGYSAWSRYLRGYASFVDRDYGLKDGGYSVRCLRDAGVGGGDTPGGDEPTIVDTVTCYPNLGSNVPEKKTVTRGENLELSTTFTHPVSTNWEISGWNTSADGTGTSYTNTITTSGNLTLYAQWHTFCTGTPNTSVNEFGSNRIDSLQDADNNKYTVVQIGNQCWMKENLRTTKKPNNEAITEGMWTPGSYSVETYGRLYSWTTMMNGDSSSVANPSGVQGICPAGWHVPSDAEWKQMEMAVGMSESDANGTSFRGSIAAKLSGNTGWNSSPNDDAPGNTYAPDRNSTGFSALPAGYYRINGHYYFSQGAYFWSATAKGSDGEAFGRSLHFAKAGVSRAGIEYIHGFSVRCVRD